MKIRKTKVFASKQVDSNALRIIKSIVELECKYLIESIAQEEELDVSDFSINIEQDSNIIWGSVRQQDLRLNDIYKYFLYETADLIKDRFLNYKDEQLDSSLENIDIKVSVWPTNELKIEVI